MDFLTALQPSFNTLWHLIPFVVLGDILASPWSIYRYTRELQGRTPMIFFNQPGLDS